MNEANEQLKTLISSQIGCEILEVGGDGVHFEALIVSNAFEGLSRVKRHQLVYSSLGDRMKGEIHALSMRTYTPEEWNAQSG